MVESRNRIRVARPGIAAGAGKGPLAGVTALVGQHRLFAAFIIAGIMLGGAGRNYPLLEMALQLLALCVLASAVRHRAGAVWTWPARWIGGLLSAAGVVMALQLVPLPSGIWQALPGHGIATQVDAAIGWAIWRPLSLTPDATAGGLLALLPVLAAWIGCLALGQTARKNLIVLLAGLALAVALLGLLQVAGPVDSLLFPFRTAHQGVGVGLFVNRNHQACFLLVAMPLTMAAADRATGRNWRLICVVAVVVMAMGVVATLSRTGLALLPAVGLVVLAQGGALRNWKRRIIALLSGVGLTVFLWLSPALAMALARFSSVAEDSRFDYWRNTLFALKDTLPLGTGIGSFRAIYASIEPLGQAQPLYVEHAHDDGLEVLLEAGWPGLALVVGLLMAALWACWRMHRDHPHDRSRLSLARAALAGLVVMAACSLVDYPLRMPALGMVAGVCLALLLPSLQRGGGNRAAPDRGMWQALPVAVLVAVPVVQQGVGQQLVLAGQSAVATDWAPWLSAGWSARANEQQAVGDHAGAMASALRALRIQPMNAQALRVLGVSRLMVGQDRGGVAVMQVAAQLGWRDVMTQNWLIDQAIGHGQYDVAVHGVDAALRLGVAPEPYYTLLRDMVPQPQARLALADALAGRPGWRKGFFNALADDAVSQKAGIAQLLNDMARAGAAADTEETALLRWRLADAGDFPGVALLWQLTGGKGGLGHPAFDVPSGPLPATAAPLTWRAPVLPGVSVNIVRAAEGEGQVARISSDGIASGAALVQTLALPVGAYVATLQLDVGRDADMLPDLMLACRSGAGQGSARGPLDLRWTRDGAGHRTGRGRFAIDGSCPGQDLSLLLKASPDGQLVYSVRTLQIDRAW